ncbi:hypothetical protein I350_05966 [Cryptococcus amylolentus CBS 6273]|uniref:DNA polymerase n=1 Tax=Cryptococcus amylolentus CBS 6273 TaxID=1296118 RepID=A0A1E3JQH3_9TREE|nr:hypothetical protein I350_05966 [Cryptococcus amylolentus CBS 6273]
MATQLAVACSIRSLNTVRSFGHFGRLSPQRTKEYYGFKRCYNAADFAKLSVDGDTLTQGLRNLLSWRALTADTTKTVDYRDALNAILPLAEETKGQILLTDIEEVITPENSVTWRLIRNLVEDGKIPEMEQADDAMKASILFNRVRGFGKVRALEFAKDGVRTLDDLYHFKDGKWPISDAQKLAIEFHEDMEQAIPRTEVQEFDVLLKDAFHKADPNLKYTIMGSYRRGENVSQDVDVVVWHESYPKKEKDEKRVHKVKPDSIMGKILTSLFNANIVEESKIFSKGPKQVFALARLPKDPNAVHRQLNIRFCPVQSLPFMLLSGTGDDMFYVKMRKRALNKDWMLNDLALGERTLDTRSSAVKEGTEITADSERDVFEALGIPYLEPTERSYSKYKNRF